MNKLRVLDLFSGIGGFSLGLERTGGFETVAFCEIEAFPRKVLAKHWPHAPCYDDVQTLTAERLAADGIAVDVICGGFPCQDISTAGHGAGIEGERSGLWAEYARLIGELRPSYVIVENVAALLGRGMGRVLGDLAALGYDAEWHCIPASALGALHRRDRLWVLGYPNREGQLQPQGRQQDFRGRTGYASKALADTHSDGHGHQHRSGKDTGSPRAGEGKGHQRQRVWPVSRRSGEDVADAERRRLQGRNEQCSRSTTIIPAAFSGYCRGSEFGSPWWVEPNVGRVAHGVPDGMDRLKGLGNAVVPQIPELIGRAILTSLADERLAA